MNKDTPVQPEPCMYPDCNRHGKTLWPGWRLCKDHRRVARHLLDAIHKRELETEAQYRRNAQGASR